MNKEIRVLIVCRSANGEITSFVKEQVESLEKTCGVAFDFAVVDRKGLPGYLMGYFNLLKKLFFGRYHIVHAHYGLSGLLACLQFFKPVVITFHGCDVNDPKTRWISRLGYKLCKHAIFVEAEMPRKLNALKKYSVIPCGIDVNVFKPMDKNAARRQLNILPGQKIALFASAFDIPVKNYVLAKEACSQFSDLTLFELKGLDRQKVNVLLNAADFLLLTSIREGSPQIIKEALACNCPIVSTRVGDVEDRLRGATESYVSDHNTTSIAEKIAVVLSSGQRSTGRENIFRDQLDLDSVSSRINKIYNSIAK